MAHTQCCVLCFWVHDPQNMWHLLTSVKQWKFIYGSPKQSSKTDLLVLSCSSSLWFLFPPRVSLPMVVFFCHPDRKICVLCSCVKTRGNCLEQAGGRHMHCCQQHVHTESCFVCVGRKAVLVFQCSGMHGLRLLQFEVGQGLCLALYFWNKDYALPHAIIYKWWGCLCILFTQAVTSCTTLLKPAISGAQHATA